MNAEMVAESWGEPPLQLLESGVTYWSYPCFLTEAAIRFPVTGWRSIVELEDNRVVRLTQTNVFTNDLNSFQGKTQQLVRFFFGKPSDVVESSINEIWFYLNRVSFVFVGGVVEGWVRER
ncbi:hypothetical protein ACFLS0_04830 [Candidatus Bipolaricaulota bacterium]